MTLRFPLLLLALGAVACGGADERASSPMAAAPRPMAATPTPEPAERASPAREARRGVRVVVSGSPFGRMLWGPQRRALYIFERDRPGESRCYGDCAEAWPPLYAEGRPVAGPGVKRSLLGVTRRRDGRRQVTYRGMPLYFYAHEGPREVRCHNVFLDGGLWWVVGPDGRRLP